MSTLYNKFTEIIVFFRQRKENLMNRKPTDKDISQQFVDRLLYWNETENQRQMPWKGEKDPYKIWLSEIILQQTRVEQGLAYYERFVKAFPTVADLAKAPEQEVFKLWEGLGYYSRCRNLIASAQQILEERKGIFPADYASILSLKGIGAYTATAIASFVYNLPYAVLDGNVFRVLSRIFNIETAIDSTAGKKNFAALTQSLLPAHKAAAYNQAIMDFGATICKPAPLCNECFFNDKCRAYLMGKQQLLPVKEKKTSVRERWFNYFVLQHKQQYAIKQRIEKDIWQSLFEFPLIETQKNISLPQVLTAFEKRFGLASDAYKILETAPSTRQKLSHQLIHFRFIKAEVKNKKVLNENFDWLSPEDLQKRPFPKSLQAYIHAQL